MLKSAIVRITDTCTRHAWYVIVVALGLSAFSAGYAERHFAIKTDVNELMSPELPWAQRVQTFLRAFPQREILVVVEAPTPELVEQAAGRLQEALQSNPEMFPSVREPQGDIFFKRNGLLYLPTEEVRKLADWLPRAGSLLETLAGDPSLRGALDALSLGLAAVPRKELTLDEMAATQTMASETIEAALAGRFATFSWQALVNSELAKASDLRRLIEVQPSLDFGALEPGRTATDAIRQAAADQHLAADYGARVRLTGLIPIADDEFDTIKQNAWLNATISLLMVIAILWMALRSVRIIFAVAVSITMGLAISAAWGLFLVGALNLISAGFFVLFVGLGIDFGIQFCIRYRAERYDCGDLSTALHNTAVKAGAPLALAAAATAAGFSSFLPTDYRGLSACWLSSIRVASRVPSAFRRSLRWIDFSIAIGRRLWLRRFLPSSLPRRCSCSCRSTSIRCTCVIQMSSRSLHFLSCATTRRPKSIPSRSLRQAWLRRI